MKDVITDNDGTIIAPPSLVVPGALNINGNTTLGDASGDSVTINAGTLSAPNATSTTSTRLANVGALRNQSLEDWHARRCIEIPDNPNGWAKFTTSGSFDGGESMFLMARTTASGSGVALATTWLTTGRNWSFGLVGDSSNSTRIKLNKKISISFVFGLGSSTSDAVASFYFGGVSTRAIAATPRDMDALGVGLRVENGNIYGLAHDGTSQRKTSALMATTNGYYYIFRIDMDGSMNVAFSVQQSGGIATYSRSLSGALTTGEVNPSMEISLSNNGNAEVRWFFVNSIRFTIDR